MSGSPIDLMNLLQPGALLSWGLFAAGGALASVPILIHLLSRRRVRRVPWAAMHWLRAAMKRHQRRLRLENWLILALRIAAIVLLGLALARPVLTDSSLAPLLGSKRSVYLVLDNSFSMAAKVDARSVLDRVKHEADLVLGSIAPGDAAAVVVTNDDNEDVTSGRDPRVLLARTIGAEGATRARESIAALHVRDAAADWVKALDLIQAQMSDEDPNRTVIVVTDLQAKDWLKPERERSGGAKAAAPEGASRLRQRLLALLRRPARVRIIDVGGTDRRDLAVTSIENRTGQDPFVGRPLRLAVTVTNFGAAPVAGAQLEVSIDDSDRKRIFPVPDLAGADTGLRVPRPTSEIVQVHLPRSTFARAGSHAVHVTVTPPRTDPGADALGLSSERWLALQVRRRINVLAWSRTSKSEDRSVTAALYLRGIYEGSAAGDDGDARNGGGLPPIYRYTAATTADDLLARLEARGREPVDLVVLANVRPRGQRLQAALRTYVRAGGGLLVFTGDNTSSDVLNVAFHDEDPEQRLLPFALQTRQVHRRDDDGSGYFSLDLAFQEDPHPLAEPFTNVRADDWIKRVPPRIWGRNTFDVSAPLPPAPGDGSDATGNGRKPSGRVVLRYKDGEAAVVSGRFGEGRTVWVGTSIDNGWLATSVLFLPVFLEESAMFLTRPAAAGRNLDVGGILRASVPAEAEQVRIEPPGGRATSPTRRTPENVAEGEPPTRIDYEYAGVGRSGIWRLTYDITGLGGEAQKITEVFAVNPDPQEGALLPATEAAMRDGIPGELDLGFLHSYGDVNAELEEAREGEVTRFVLLALLAVLLLESLLAMKFGRRGRSSEPV